MPGPYPVPIAGEADGVGQVVMLANRATCLHSVTHCYQPLHDGVHSIVFSFVDGV